MKYPEDFVNKIIQGDCLDVMCKIPSQSIDAVVTDPPFGIGFRYEIAEKFNNPHDWWNWFYQVYGEIQRVLKDGGFCALWTPALYLSYAWDWYGKDIHIYAACKNFVQLRKTPINYGFDPVVMWYKGKPELRPLKPKRNIDFFVANTAKFVTEKNSLCRQHPCPRPIDQTIEIIKNFTIENGLVLDPFSGSGTIAVACKSLERNFIGIEFEKKYCEISEKRLSQLSFI